MKFESVREALVETVNLNPDAGKIGFFSTHFKKITRKSPTHIHV